MEDKETIRTRHYRPGDPLYNARVKFGPKFQVVLRREIEAIRPFASLLSLSSKEKEELYRRLEAL